MDAIDCKVGLVVDGAIHNRYFQGVVESLLFTLDSDNGLVPSAVVKLLPDSDNFTTEEERITVPVTIFED